MNPEFSAESTSAMLSRALRRHKWKSLAFFAAIIAAVLLFNAFGPHRYRSEGKILVRLGRENSALDPTVTLGHEQVLSVPPFRDNEINSVVEILNSRALAEQVVDALGPDAVLSGSGTATRDPRSGSADEDLRQKALRRLMSNLDVAPVTRSNVIHVSYQSSSPEASQAVLARLMEIFLADYVRLQRPADGADFLEKQAERMQAELRQADDALQHLKSETEILSPEARRAIVAKRVGTLEDEALQTAGDLAVAEAAAAELRSKLAGMSPTAVVGETQGIGDEGTNRMRDRFYALQIAEKEARAKLGEAHPRMKEILAQEAAAQDILDRQQSTRSQVTRAPDRAYVDLKLQLANQEVALRSLKSKAAAVDAQLADARRGLRRFSEQEVQIARLERERDIQDARYRKFAAVAEEARVDQDLEAQRMSNISVFQPASFDPALVLPRRSLNLAAGVLVGLLGAAGVALIAETRAPRCGPVAAPRRQWEMPTNVVRSTDGPRVTVVTSP